MNIDPQAPKLKAACVSSRSWSRAVAGRGVISSTLQRPAGTRPLCRSGLLAGQGGRRLRPRIESLACRPARRCHEAVARSVRHRRPSRASVYHKRWSAIRRRPRSQLEGRRADPPSPSPPPCPPIPRVYTPHAFRTMDPTLGKAGRLIFGSIETILASSSPIT